MKQLTIRKPDDFHVHLREGDLLRQILPYTSRVFPRAMVKGNLRRGSIDSASRVREYRREIFDADPNFNPVMAVMLTKNTTIKSLEESYQAGARVLAHIPGDASTNSAGGVPLDELVFYSDVLRRACKFDINMVFSGHLERTVDEKGEKIPERFREEYAIDDLDWLVQEFPGLKISVEHMSTRLMIDYVRSAPANVGGSVSVHHAVLSIADVFDENGKINPDHYCKPIAKTARDRQAVLEAMISGDPKIFFGSDSAPHENKDPNDPPAGIFTAPVVLPILAEIFEKLGFLDRLENFVSRFGAEFYGFPLNEGTITLKKESWVVPEKVGNVRVFLGGKTLNWKVV